jgi:hypothetical protein
MHRIFRTACGRVGRTLYKAGKKPNNVFSIKQIRDEKFPQNGCEIRKSGYFNSLSY